MSTATKTIPASVRNDFIWFSPLPGDIGATPAGRGRRPGTWWCGECQLPFPAPSPPAWQTPGRSFGSVLCPAILEQRLLDGAADREHGGVGNASSHFPRRRLPRGRHQDVHTVRCPAGRERGLVEQFTVCEDRIPTPQVAGVSLQSQTFGAGDH